MVAIFEVKITRIELLNRYEVFRKLSPLIVLSLDAQQFSCRIPSAGIGHLEEKFRFELSGTANVLSIQLYKLEEDNIEKRTLMGEGGLKILQHMSTKKLECWVDIMSQQEPIATVKLEAEIIHDQKPTGMIEDITQKIHNHKEITTESRAQQPAEMFSMAGGPRPKDKRVSFNMNPDEVELNESAKDAAAMFHLEKMDDYDPGHLPPTEKERIRAHQMQSKMTQPHMEPDIDIPLDDDDEIQGFRHQRQPVLGMIFGPRFGGADRVVSSIGDREIEEEEMGKHTEMMTKEDLKLGHIQANEVARMKENPLKIE